MRNLIYFQFLLIIFWSSCSEKNIIPQTGISLRDSLIKKIRATGDVDTLETYYKLLNAYAANDTAFLSTLLNTIEAEQKSIPKTNFTGNCFHQPGLQQLDADEAYRFIYRTMMCPYGLTITITKKGNVSGLHFVVYEFRQDSIICINEYDKSITPGNWMEIIQSLTKADFWGLRKDNGARGMDGSELTVIGFSKGDNYRNDRFNDVTRWFGVGVQPTIVETLEKVLELTGKGKYCFNWVEQQSIISRTQ